MKLVATVVLLLALLGLQAQPVHAAGSIPIPYSEAWIVAEAYNVDCDGAAVTVRWYVEQENDPAFVAGSVAVAGGRPFAWGIRHYDGSIWLYADSDSDGMAESRITWEDAIKKYESSWCNVYLDLVKKS